MKINYFIACLLFSIIPLLNGCIAHSTISESVMFQSDKKNPVHKNTSGFGFAGSYTPTRKTAARFAEIVYPEYSTRNSDLPINPNQFSGGLYYAGFDSLGRYAFSVTAGVLVVGIDATAKIWGRNYVTAGYSLGGHGQLYLQHRTLNNSKHSIALGLGYQRTAFFFNSPSGGFGIDSNGLDSFGVRSSIIFKNDTELAARNKVGVYMGYAPLIDYPVIQLTLVMGRF